MTAVDVALHRWQDLPPPEQAPLRGLAGVLALCGRDAKGRQAYRKAGFVDHGTLSAGRIGLERHMSRPLDDTVRAANEGSA